MTLSVPDPRRPRVLRQFADQCRASTSGGQAARTREARALSGSKLAPQLIEVMIAANAFESAALALVRTDATWMLSKGGDGRCLASMVLRGMTEEVTCDGATPALALLGAWAIATVVVFGQPQQPEAAIPLRPDGALLH